MVKNRLGMAIHRWGLGMVELLMPGFGSGADKESAIQTLIL